MDYKIVEREQFKVIARVERFQNEIVQQKGNREIPDFWDRSGKEGVFGIFSNLSDTHDIYGVCGHISKESDSFEYGIGFIRNFFLVQTMIC